MDLNKVTDIEIDGIDRNDHPDYCDAYIANAKYDGIEMTEEQLDEVNEYSDFVYAKVWEHLH